VDDPMISAAALDGWRVMLCRGEDGTMLVQVDSPKDKDCDADGAPRCRVYLNDADEPLYENPRLRCCAECGETIREDDSPGVLVHAGEDGHERDADHTPYESEGP